MKNSNINELILLSRELLEDIIQRHKILDEYPVEENLIDLISFDKIKVICKLTRNYFNLALDPDMQKEMEYFLAMILKDKDFRFTLYEKYKTNVAIEVDIDDLKISFKDFNQIWGDNSLLRQINYSKLTDKQVQLASILFLALLNARFSETFFNEYFLLFNRYFLENDVRQNISKNVKEKLPDFNYFEDK